MTSKTERIAIRVSKATKAKLEESAKKENRSMSNYIENIIIQDLEEKEMTINHVLGNIKNLVGTKFDTEEVVEVKPQETVTSIQKEKYDNHKKILELINQHDLW